MKHYLSEDKAIQFAYSSIHDFFDCYGLEDAVRTWESIILAAGSKRPWSREVPHHLLLFIEKLEELCKAAVTISNGGIHATAMVNKPGKVLLPNIHRQPDFVNSQRHSNAWNCFPRSLTEKQYMDPHRAIKKFAGFMPETSCKKILKNVQEYALSGSTIDGVYNSGYMFKIRLRLLQLIEACHLIEVRVCMQKSHVK